MTGLRPDDPSSLDADMVSMTVMSTRTHEWKPIDVSPLNKIEDQKDVKAGCFTKRGRRLAQVFSFQVGHRSTQRLAARPDCCTMSSKHGADVGVGPVQSERMRQN